jgi:predicted permease
LRDVSADLRYAARLFARQPAVLVLAILGLSLGLGIATAAFSIMNAAALRGNGLVDSHRVPAVLRATDRSEWTVWRYDEFLDLRAGSTRMQVEAVLSDFAQVRTTAAAAEAPSAALSFVSGGFFATTGGRLMAGRPLEPPDERHAGPPPVVVSFVFWSSALNRDPQAVGRTIRVGATDATIVGVAERGFSVPRGPVLWLPLTAYGAVYDASAVRRAPDSGLDVFGRLLPDVPIAEAEAQLSAVAAALPASASGPSPLRARLDPDAGLGRVASAQARAITLLVSAVIGLMLLLACANVATVLISTAITREREMGVRAALGASRRRIVRQLITESLALGTIAALIGLLFAFWAIPIIGRMLEAPAGTDLAPDLNVYLFLGIVTLLTGVAAGLAPVRHGRGVDLVTPLKGDARQNRLAPRRLRAFLVTAQAAISVLLLVLATLFMRASFRAAAIDVGFDTAGLYAISAGLGDAVDDGGAGIRNFWARAIPELEALPGVQAVSLADVTPFGGFSTTSMTRGEPARVVNLNGTDAAYFEALGLRTLAGRTYTRDEVAARAPVAVVSQTLARTYWSNQSPLGQLLPAEVPLPLTRPVVIGVVDDVITASLHDRNVLAVYQPRDPGFERFARLMIRVVPGMPSVVDDARQRLRAIDPRADVEITSIASRVQQAAGQPRVLAMLTAVVGAIAIVLCVIGLYGLTASVVGQRAREMAVRAAIGAEPRALLRLLMWDSLRPVLIGLAAGVAAALLAGRVMGAAMFFSVSPQDPIAFAGAAAILLVAATLAVLAPTRRAASVDAALVLKGP